MFHSNKRGNLHKICITLLFSSLLNLTPLYGAQKMHDFNSLSLQQLLEQLDKAGDNVGTGFITEFTKRLINLTYFERKISIEDRKKGEQLVSGLIP